MKSPPKLVNIPLRDQFPFCASHVYRSLFFSFGQNQTRPTQPRSVKVSSSRKGFVLLPRSLECLPGEQSPDNAAADAIFTGNHLREGEKREWEFDRYFSSNHPSLSPPLSRQFLNPLEELFLSTVCVSSVHSVPRFKHLVSPHLFHLLSSNSRSTTFRPPIIFCSTRKNWRRRERRGSVNEGIALERKHTKGGRVFSASDSRFDRANRGNAV